MIAVKYSHAPPECRSNVPLQCLNSPRKEGGEENSSSSASVPPRPFIQSYCSYGGGRGGLSLYYATVLQLQHQCLYLLPPMQLSYKLNPTAGIYRAPVWFCGVNLGGVGGGVRLTCAAALKPPVRCVCVTVTHLHTTVFYLILFVVICWVI